LLRWILAATNAKISLLGRWTSPPRTTEQGRQLAHVTGPSPWAAQFS
jgi:hypothetical protein